MANPVFDLITRPYTPPPPFSADANLFYYQLIFLLGLFDTMHDFHNNSLLSFYKQYLDYYNITTRELHPLLKPIKVLSLPVLISFPVLEIELPDPMIKLRVPEDKLYPV